MCDRVRQGALRCLGHVERKDECDWVSACRDMAVAGKEAEKEIENLEGVYSGWHGEDEFGKGRCTRLWFEEMWDFGKSFNPCKHRNTDVKTVINE